MKTDLNNLCVQNTFASDSGQTNENPKWFKFIHYLNSKHSAGFGGGCLNEYYGVNDGREFVEIEIPDGVELITIDQALDIINFFYFNDRNKTFYVQRPSQSGDDWDEFIAELNKNGTSFDGTQDPGAYGLSNGMPKCIGENGMSNLMFPMITIEEGTRLLKFITNHKEHMENTTVETYNGDEHPLVNCVQLCDGSAHDGAYALNTDTVWSRPHGGHILRDEATQDRYGHWFNEDYADDLDYVWSEYNDSWLCTNWHDTVYGYTSRRNEEYFVSDEYVYAGSQYFADSNIANEHGYYYDDHDGEWYHEDDERPSQVSRYNSGYHSGRGRGWKAGDKPKFTVGFEIEKEDNDAGCIPWQGVYGRTGWIKESDGSLDEDGYELVSPIFNLYTDDVDKEIDSDKELQRLIDAEYSDNCGGHINLGSSMYTPAQLFEGLSAFMPLMYSMYTGRLTRSYCQAKEKYKYRSSSDKYASVFIKDQVVEFRIFPAVRSVKNLIWRRDFLRLMCDNINKSELDVLKMLVNQNSKMYKHMRKIYSQDELLEKTKLFIYYSERFNDKKLPPIDPKKFKKGDDNITDSTEDLGA
jgi:hypothetical protein